MRWALLLFLPLAIPAQSDVGTPTVGPRVDADAARIRDEKQREMQLRNLEASTARTDEKFVKSAVEQLNQDFKRIQLIRNEVVDTLVAKKPLDYKQVSEQAAEINKRAVRLKSFMMQSDLEEKDKDTALPPEYDGEQIKGALVKRCNTVYNFTNNPMFKDPATVDARKAAIAGGDLMTIIHLSDNVKASAERLSKTPK